MKKPFALANGSSHIDNPLLNQFFDEDDTFKENYNPDPIDLRDVNI